MTVKRRHLLYFPTFASIDLIPLYRRRLSSRLQECSSSYRFSFPQTIRIACHATADTGIERRLFVCLPSERVHRRCREALHLGYSANLPGHYVYVHLGFCAPERTLSRRKQMGHSTKATLPNATVPHGARDYDYVGFQTMARSCNDSGDGE